LTGYFLDVQISRNVSYQLRDVDHDVGDIDVEPDLIDDQCGTVIHGVGYERNNASADGYETERWKSD
jgi:hypothetical protein